MHRGRRVDTVAMALLRGPSKSLKFAQCTAVCYPENFSLQHLCQNVCCSLQFCSGNFQKPWSLHGWYMCIFYSIQTFFLRCVCNVWIEDKWTEGNACFGKLKSLNQVDRGTKDMKLFVAMRLDSSHQWNTNCVQTRQEASAQSHTNKEGMLEF